MNSSSNFMSNIDWFESVLGDKDVILCFTSALECLQMFLGYFNETIFKNILSLLVIWASF